MLDTFSYRLACVVHIAARLFDASVENAPENLPTAGPAARTDATPSMREESAPGKEDYRRVWTLTPPRTGASAAARDGGLFFSSGGTSVTTGRKDALDGFEEPAPADTAVEDLGGDYTGPVIIGDRGDESVVYAKILPRKVTLRLNAYRTADEAEIELPIQALPLPADGSLIRSIMVEVRRGVIGADAWAKINTEGGDVTDVAFAADDGEPDFVGFADVHRVRFPESGASHVSLTCRDFFGILADTAMQGRVLRPDLDLDEAVAVFIGSIPAMIGMRVVWIGPELPPQGPEHPKVKTSKKGKPLASQQQKAEKQSCLDSLVEFCTLAGVIMTVRGYTIELRAPRTLDQLAARGVRRMVLGENLRSLEFEHKLTKAHLRRVAVVSFNQDTGHTLRAMWPTSKEPGEVNPPGAHNAEAPDPAAFLQTPPGVQAFDEHSAEVFEVRGVNDPQRLQDIARATWEEMARQDVSVKIETRDIATIEGRALGVADLLALRAGDPLAIEIAPPTEDRVSSYIQRLARLPRGEAVDLLVARGYLRTVAERVVDGILVAGRPTIYYVREVEFSWGANAATEMTITLVNYIQVVDQELLGKKPKGGNRKALQAAGGGSFEATWNAIEADMAAGELTPKAAADLQGQLLDIEGVEDLN